MRHSSFSRGLVVALFSLSISALSVPVFAADAKPVAAADGLTLPAGVTRGPTAEGIAEYRFANGFRLLLLPDASQPVTTVNIVYRVGARHENYGETGMAHLLEHMLFKGTPRHPAIPQGFSQRGATFNATTSLDYTNYIERFQASDDNLSWVIALEADRMLHSNVARKDLDSEMTVVRNEFEERENNPHLVMLKRLQSVAYDWHSYGRSPIGNRSDIENVKIANLQAFYRTYYQPDNAVMVIAGQFDTAKALRWVNQGFGKMARPTRKLPQFWTVEPTQDGERQFTIRRQGDVQLVTLAYKVPSQLHTDFNALKMAEAVLINAPEGRLHKALVEAGLASDVSAFPLNGLEPGMISVVATAKADADTEAIKRVMISAFESFGKTPPTTEEIARIKLAYANEYVSTQSNPDALANALTDAIARGDWRHFFAARDDFAGIEAQQVTTVADKYFRRDNRTIGLFLPEAQPQRTEVPAAPSMAQALAHYQPRAAIGAGETFDASPANIAQRTIVLPPGQGQQTGLKLALLSKKTRGATVNVSLDLNMGDQHSLAGKQAQSMMTNMMLMRGTTSKTRQQLSDTLNALQFSGNVFQFQTTRAHLVPALTLMAEILRQPRFDAAEFEQLRNELLTNLEASRGDPKTLASDAMARTFNHYPAGDVRNEMSADEKIAAVKNVTLAQVKQFHHDFFGASSGELAIVGDFDPASAIAAIDQGLGNWSSKLPYARVTRSWHEVAAGRQNLDTPDKENGIYLARQNIRMRDSDPDYTAMLVANYLIGDGPLKSRLFDRVRQQDGLSYVVGSRLTVNASDDAGFFMVYAIAAPQNQEKVDAAVHQELARVVSEGFTAQELERAKSGLLQGRLQYRAQDAAVAADWVGLLDLDRTWQWQAQEDQRIAALTLEQLNAAVRKHLDPAGLTVVIARDPAKLQQKP